MWKLRTRIAQVDSEHIRVLLASKLTGGEENEVFRIGWKAKKLVAFYKENKDEIQEVIKLADEVMDTVKEIKAKSE